MHRDTATAAIETALAILRRLRADNPQDENSRLVAIAALNRLLQRELPGNNQPKLF